MTRVKKRVKSIHSNDNDDEKLKKQTTNNFNDERKDREAFENASKIKTSKINVGKISEKAGVVRRWRQV